MNQSFQLRQALIKFKKKILKQRKPVFGVFFLLWSALIASSAEASDTGCYGLNEGCVSRRSGSSSGTGQSSSQVKINPAAVPTEKGLGLGGIFFKTEVDVMLVRGNGRVGAAISPSNSESTFYGPPALELDESYLVRKIDSEKYASQKYTLATAINLLDKKGSGLKRFSLNVGIMGKYNNITHVTTPGGGLTGVFGPFTFGYSVYQDQTLIDNAAVYGPLFTPAQQVFKYQVQTYNVGFYLSSLILDYSNLRLIHEGGLITPSIVNLYTASLFLRKFIITASHRTEVSAAKAYNYETRLLEDKQNKEETFFGVQYNLTKNMMVGVLYNYYLLHEYSGALTFFF